MRKFLTALLLAVSAAGICVVHGWRNKHESTAVGEFDDDRNVGVA